MVASAICFFGNMKSVLAQATKATPTTEITCQREDFRDSLHARAKDIVGLYSRSVEGLPAYSWPSEEKRHGFDLLAITQISGNQLRVRLATNEVNGHDCAIDSRALLCGATIRLVPSKDEIRTLTDHALPPPKLHITKSEIAFAPNPDGTFVWGSPYCGTSGYLRHSFSRSTQHVKFDETIFKK